MATRKKSSVIDPFTSAIEGVAGPSNSSSNPLVKGSYYPLTTDGKEPNFWNTHSESNPGNQYWMQLLSALGQRFGIGQSDLVDFLSSIGLPTGHDISDAQLTDLNKQFVDSLLSAASEQDARNYNLERLAEQRLYDNPQNQLARLMGAGISRDAAIQMLSGAGGSGSGGVVTGQAATMPSGIPATQSDLNNIHAKMAIPQTVFGAIGSLAGAIGSLGMFGISAASLSTNLAATKAATAGQLLHNTQFDKTLQGIETASTVIGAISSAVDAGFLSPDHEFGSAQDMLKTIRNNADKYEPFGNLVKSGALDSIARDVYSLNALNAGYKSWRESRDYGIDRKHIVRMQALDELFKSIDIDKLNSEIALNSQRIDESIASVLNSTKLANSAVELNSAQKVLAYSQASVADKQSDILNQQYEMQQSDLDWLNASIDDINSIRTNELMLAAAQWQQFGDPSSKEFQDEVQSWLQNKRNLRTAIAIESYYYGDKLSAIESRNNPNAPFNSDQNIANMVVYYHNLFSNALPGKPASRNESDLLGDLSGSAVATWALRKFVHLP